MKNWLPPLLKNFLWADLSPVLLLKSNLSIKNINNKYNLLCSKFLSILLFLTGQLHFTSITILITLDWVYIFVNMAFRIL